MLSEVSINAFDVIQLLLLCVSVIGAVRYNNYRMKQDNERKFGSKADVVYVDKQDDIISKKVDKIEMSQNNVVNEIFEQLREIRKYIIESK